MCQVHTIRDLEKVVADFVAPQLLKVVAQMLVVVLNEVVANMLVGVVFFARVVVLVN